MINRYYELRTMFAVPNGGHRHPAVGAKMKREGALAGVSDIMLPVAKGKYHGLFVELKRKAGSHTSEAQKEFQALVNDNGYLAVVCRGADEAIETIENYLNLGVFTG